MTIDIEHLNRLHAATTQGNYHVDGGGYLEICNENDARVARCYSSGSVDDVTCESNAAWIAAAHNAWPEIAAELQRLETLVATELKIALSIGTTAALTGCVKPESKSTLDAVCDMANEIERLREENARLKADIAIKQNGVAN